MKEKRRELINKLDDVAERLFESNKTITPEEVQAYRVRYVCGIMNAKTELVNTRREKLSESMLEAILLMIEFLKEEE